MTARDLNAEQSYLRSADRCIGETPLPLDARFIAAGTANVVLYFDEADALFGKRTEVKDGHDRYAEDFLIFNPSTGTWRGRLYLEELGNIEAGIYDDVMGRFENLSTVPQPAALAVDLLAQPISRPRRSTRLRRLSLDSTAAAPSSSA